MIKRIIDFIEEVHLRYHVIVVFFQSCTGVFYTVLSHIIFC